MPEGDKPVPKFNNNGNSSNHNTNFNKSKQQGCYVCGGNHFKRDCPNVNSSNRNSGNSLKTAGIHACGATNDTGSEQETMAKTAMIGHCAAATSAGDVLNSSNVARVDTKVDIGHVADLQETWFVDMSD